VENVLTQKRSAIIRNSAMTSKRLLILGGTSDANKLAQKAGNLPDLEVQVSLAGSIRQAGGVPKIVRIGGFGGVAGLTQYLRAEGINFLVDATHPFAAQISGNAAVASQKLGLPRLMLVRPGWEKATGDGILGSMTNCDRWIEVDSLESAAISLQNQPAKRVFLSIGKQKLTIFSHLQDMWFLMRAIDPPAANAIIPPGELILSKGPFDVSEEKQLLLEYKIDTIVSKNSGGDDTYAKILAARELGIKVIMIQRPQIPAGEIVADVESAMVWLAGKLSEGI
jgi:precorrin-6A/cobalt-precorrin-6A reductase